MKSNLVRFLVISIVLVMITSCTNDELTLEKLKSVQIKKETYTSVNLSYMVSLPEGWKLSDSIRTDKVQGDAFKSDQDNIGIISVEKYKSNPNNLAQEAEMVEARFSKNMPKAEIIESGKTDVMENECYFFNAKIEGENPIQNMYFIVASTYDSSYFVIGISSKIDKKSAKNLSTLLASIKTFKLTK